MNMVNIGFGNIVNVSRVLAIVGPEAAPVKRMVQEAKASGQLIDGTCGRRTRAVIVTDGNYLVLSALQPETIAARVSAGGALEE